MSAMPVVFPSMVGAGKDWGGGNLTVPEKVRMVAAVASAAVVRVAMLAVAVAVAVAVAGAGGGRRSTAAATTCRKLTMRRVSEGAAAAAREGLKRRRQTDGPEGDGECYEQRQ